MDENVYEKVNATTGNDRKIELSSDKFSYRTNACYELQSYQQQNDTAVNAQDHEHQSSRLDSGREGEHSGYHGDLRGTIKKRCLVTLSFIVLLVALVAITALAVGVIQLSDSSRNQLDQLQNMTMELERKLKNKDSSLKSQYDQLQSMAIEFERKESSLKNQLDLIQNMTIEKERRLTDKDSFLSEQIDQLTNETHKKEQELTGNINALKIQQHQSVSSTRVNISQLVGNINKINDDVSSLQEQIYCGAGQWNRVAFLNMSDPSRQCPSAWRLVTTSGVRACGRRQSTRSSCHSKVFTTTNEYNQVCGRVIGYQNNSPDGFHRLVTGNNGINNAYLDGVSITYGHTRKHIWSYAAGVTERSSSHTRINCPCSPVAGTRPPSFVGDNYYCESGNPTNTWGPFYSTDKLWDGKQCEGTCCSGSKSLPWFSVHLPNPTTANIEVRICGDQTSSDEDTLIELLEIYVQ